MSEPRAHHIVPQFHLRRFADNKKRIRMVSRDQKSSFVSGVRSACVERDFYAIETAEGWSQEVEKALSEIEGIAAPAIDRMLKGGFPPNVDDREAVALMIAFQCMRGNDIRAMTGQVTEYMGRLMISNFTQNDLRHIFTEAEGRSPSDAEIADLAKLVKEIARHAKIVPHQNESIRMMLDVAPKLSRLMSARQWFLCDVCEPCLLTSDAPVGRWSAPTKPEAAIHGNGWGVADEIYMPLSPRHCLVLTWPQAASPSSEAAIKLGRVRGPTLARHVNFIIAAGASRWIAHHPESSPLDGLSLPPLGPPLTIDGPEGRIINDGL